MRAIDSPCRNGMDRTEETLGRLDRQKHRLIADRLLERMNRRDLRRGRSRPDALRWSVATTVYSPTPSSIRYERGQNRREIWSSHRTLRLEDRRDPEKHRIDPHPGALLVLPICLAP